MSGKNSRMNPLESRKKLLLAESELNRAQLVQEWRSLAGEAQALTAQAKTMGVLAAAAVAVTRLLSFRHQKPAPVAGKESWLQTIFKGAEMVGLLWTKFRSPRGDETESRFKNAASGYTS